MAVSKAKTTPKAKKARAKKSPVRRKRAAAYGGAGVPRTIYANASPHSLGGVSMFAMEDVITAETVANFTSEQDLIDRAVLRLQDAGFTVLQTTESTINFRGTQRQFQEAFNTEVVAEERATLKEAGREDLATFLDCPSTDRPGLIDTRDSKFSDLLEGVALEEPNYLMTANVFPPSVNYWHLDVPGDVSLACNADRAHRTGITGKNIKVAMVDSGWFRHPYFTARGYRASNAVLGPDTSNPLQDSSGHGTGESANVFAIAPDAELLPVKAKLAGTNETVLVNTKGAFDLAVGLNPHIITNSWGLSFRNGPLSANGQALAASVATAVASGIVVCFAAGNGHWGFPGQHPDVVSVGGVYMEADGGMRASNYASGFMSNIYTNRRVPDLSGLVGEIPKAIYIMLPLAEGSNIDLGNAGNNFPNQDRTTNNDGWAAFSGTSAACPQVAGVAALMLQACPRLTPQQVRSILMSSARDVTQGTNAHGNSATTGPDTATGNGLVDAHKAVLLARLNCLQVTPVVGPTPISPTPVTPIVGPTPVGPTPVTPVVGPTPVGPTPVTPVVGPTPITPVRPTPIRPVVPINPIRPRMSAGQSLQDAQPEQTAGLSQEDVAALQQMVIAGEIDEKDLS